MSVENPTFQPSHADNCRAGELKWRNAPPGMSPGIADVFLTKLKAGKTLRELTSGMKKYGAPVMVTPQRFKKHCDLNPEWGLNQVIECYRKADRLSGDPHFAFRTGLHFHVSTYGMYSGTLRCSGI
jgi:hypothetical protein